MALSSELISEFVKVTNDTTEVKQESTVYGTIVEHEGTKYVKLDGSDLLTPIPDTTTNVESGERVTVMIKNHAVTVTGNLSSPSPSVGSVQAEIGKQISEVEILIADKVSTKEFDAQNGRIDNLISDNVLIRAELIASKATIDEVVADNVTINEKLTAQEAEITELETSKLTAKDAELKYATITDLDATNADIRNLTGDFGEFKVLTTNQFVAINADIADLDAKKLSAESAELKYVNIDFTNIDTAVMNTFYAKSGLINYVVADDGTFVGELVGVTIKGDLIEAGTLVADRLVVLGEDGLYYKLNTTGMTVEAQQTEHNSLNGSIITAKSISATKISVEDLVAFGATIGGFKITDNAIHSIAKTSATNTTRGIYMDNDGQMSFGDSNNFVKFFKDTDGQYKVAISASDIILSASGKHIETEINTVKESLENLEHLETEIDNVKDSLENLEIGARNLIRNSTNLLFEDYSFEA